LTIQSFSRLTITIKSAETRRTVWHQSQPVKLAYLAATQVGHTFEVQVDLPAGMAGMHDVLLEFHEDFPSLSQNESFLTRTSWTQHFNARPCPHLVSDAQGSQSMPPVSKSLPQHFVQDASDSEWTSVPRSRFSGQVCTCIYVHV